MKVRDLVELADLPPPLTGDAGLDRPIRWVYTTDLLDPSRYLSGGELVLTGLMWRRGPQDAAAFVSAVAARHVACVAAGDAAYGTVPEDLVDACVEHGVPLLEVPVDVSFATITERVIHALDVERRGDLAEQLGRRRRLLTAVAEGAGLDALLRLWAADAEVTCSLLTATGMSPVQPAPELPGSRLAAEFLAATSFPSVVHIGRPGDEKAYSLFGVGSPAEPRVSSWFLVCEGDYREWPRVLHESVVELASLIALERERLREGTRAERLAVEQMFRLVLSGRSSPDEVAERLADAGFADRPYVAVSASLSPVPDGQLACGILDQVLAAELPGEEVLVAPVDDEAVALVPAADAGLSAGLRARIEPLGPALDDGRLLVGLSLRAEGPAGLLAALSEARQARMLAEQRAGRIAVLGTDEIDSYALLLATVPDDVRQTFRSRVLGPVLDYDERHGSQFLATLEAFLAASGSWAQCAERLHVHVNTLRYRIQRIEELTGRSLSRLEDRVDFFLALRATPGR